MRFPSLRVQVRALTLYASALLLGLLSLGFLAQGSKVEGATSAVGAVGLAQLLHEGREARTAAEMARFEAGAAKAAARRCADPFAFPKHVGCGCSSRSSTYRDSVGIEIDGVPQIVSVHSTAAFPVNTSVAYEARAGEAGAPTVKSDPLLEIMASIDRRNRSRVEADAGRVVQGLADHLASGRPPAVLA